MFWQFSPFFMPKSKELPPLFTNLLSIKEQLKGIHSRCTLQKRDRERSIRSVCSWQKSLQERFAQVAHDKRVTGAICSILQTNPSFAQKNEWIAWKTDEQIPNLVPIQLIMLDNPQWCNHTITIMFYLWIMLYLWIPIKFVWSWSTIIMLALLTTIIASCSYSWRGKLNQS